ncbi:peptidase inhibitor family I36 protein [Actinosynnema sp. NPDC023587]|uniref:peptidase inhibitor family I36 protein n=1 Tax=Actinosynnema sp. NPDC023587 TaxID=3154695 RepID=UPI0034116BCE
MMTKSLLTALTITTTVLIPTGTATARQPAEICDRGEFCAWSGTNYTGTVQRLDLESANPDECIPLTDLVARSFVNHLTRDTSVYQGATCSTEAEFTTYPGKGTYVPDAPFVVRAIQVWGS